MSPLTPPTTISGPWLWVELGESASTTNPATVINYVLADTSPKWGISKPRQHP